MSLRILGDNVIIDNSGRSAYIISPLLPLGCSLAMEHYITGREGAMNVCALSRRIITMETQSMNNIFKTKKSISCS